MSTPTPEKTVIQDIVAKLWNLFNIFKDGGVTYHEYVTELSYLLFLKMAKETGAEEGLPEGYRWDDLEQQNIANCLDFYKQLLAHLGTHGSVMVQQIFAEARTSIRRPNTLATLVAELDKLDWYRADKENMGDLYEGLLQKNASESKSGAGQYFTPRPLIDSMVAVMRPTLEDIIQDPAAGTGGFLVSASRHMQVKLGDPGRWVEVQQDKYCRNTFYGMEIVQDTHRLALMNLMLHGMKSAPNAAGIFCGDTLSADSEQLPKATLILTNPPFGAKKGGGVPHERHFPFPTSNKQLCFLQHVYLALQPGGRAAVVLPDNVLFEGTVGRSIRVDLMDKCNLHTILRLPRGIFYAQGVNTNVLFFTRGETDKGNTREVWVYDLRANMPKFSKKTTLQRKHFGDFEDVFGDDPWGRPENLARRKDTGEEGRFRCFLREWIGTRDDNLDIAWLKDESVAGPFDFLEPKLLAEEAIDELEAALEELRGILAELSEEVDGE